jgi:hypothetical protein
MKGEECGIVDPMPILNFKKQFVEPIMAGSKVHTIRAYKIPGRIRKGQLLYCQTGSRFKPSRFAVLPVMRVREINLSRETVTIWDESGKSFVVPPLDIFAQADGFKDWAEMRDWFDVTYGADRMPTGYLLIQWIEAPWERIKKSDFK